MIPENDLIAWKVSVCASTNAELNDAWSKLKRVSLSLAEPDDSYILNLIEARYEHQRAVELIEEAVQGFARFLMTQEIYLESISAPNEEIASLETLTPPDIEAYSAAYNERLTELKNDYLENAPSLKPDQPLYDFPSFREFDWIEEVKYQFGGIEEQRKKHLDNR